MRGKPAAKGLHVIEMMVVVAIIVLLVAILLPSLQSARQHAKAVVCIRTCTTSAWPWGITFSSLKALIPPRTSIPTMPTEIGRDQPKRRSILWIPALSHYLYDSGRSATRRSSARGGAWWGAANEPGPRPEDWEGGEQIDDRQSDTADPNSLKDLQAPRMAYTANAAIMPRNKFTSTLSGGPRVNTFVKESSIKYPGATIVVAEFLDNWKALTKAGNQGGLRVSASHRPINPFYMLRREQTSTGRIQRRPASSMELPAIRRCMVC